MLSSTPILFPTPCHAFGGHPLPPLFLPAEAGIHCAAAVKGEPILHNFDPILLMSVSRFSSLWIYLFFGIAMPGCATQSLLQTSQQLLVVCTDDWNQFQGQLQRFERQDLQSAWKPVGDVVKVCIGKNGLGWGIGLHPHMATVPQKREGDLKAPAGVFKVSAVFSKAAENTYRLPLITVGPDTEAIDDPQSKYYNTIVEAHAVSKDWHSSEKMYEIDQYNLGAVVDHNLPVKDRNAGSCIFLHAWLGENSPTGGCTAMCVQDLEVLCQWLDSAKEPLMVQLPVQIYQQYMHDWQLPQVPFLQH